MGGRLALLLVLVVEAFKIGNCFVEVQGGFGGNAAREGVV
jgi:hypothetical protein